MTAPDTSPSTDQHHDDNWMQTFTGKAFYPLAPDPALIDIRDIAHSLSLQCRYNGHCSQHYSVAEHCIHISEHVPARDALAGLLHDATEAYVGDMIRPLKLQIPAFIEIEDRVWLAIAERYGLAAELPKSVEDIDKRIVADERAALLATPKKGWSSTRMPVGVHIWALSPLAAERLYLRKFYELTNTPPHERILP